MEGLLIPSAVFSFVSSKDFSFRWLEGFHLEDFSLLWSDDLLSKRLTVEDMQISYDFGYLGRHSCKWKTPQVRV